LYTKIKKIILLNVLALGISLGLYAFENRPFEEVLKEKYPKCNLRKENVFLSKEQEAKIKSELGFKISPLLLKFENYCNQSHIYIDSHILRTLNETVIIEIKDQEVIWLKIASFMEPPEYIPPQKWLDQFLGAPKESVDGLTGATLSQNVIKRLVKKYLVVDKIIHDKN
jgi:hypothetical protein